MILDTNNMLEYKIFFMVLLLHYLADFSLQTSYQAENKSKNNNALFYHVLTYSLTWLFVSFFFLFNYNIYNVIMFSFTTFLLHFITDYFTSRLTSSFFEKKDYHNGFLVIGFDQLLHYIALFGLYYITINNFYLLYYSITILSLFIFFGTLNRDNDDE